MQTSHRLRRLVAAFSLALVCLVAQAPAFARTEDAVFIRQGTLTVADQPSGVRGDLLLANDGNIYFASSSGGLGFGFIGKMTPGGTLGTVYAFGTNQAVPESVQPYAGVMQASDGNLYGTSFYGGVNGTGTVFRLSLAGQYTVLYSFGAANTTAPSLPYTGLVQAPDGNLYGTTLRGGSNDKGTIFRISLAGDFTIMHHFNGANGENPEGTLIIGSDGALHGTTLQGGPANRGTIYRITTSGAFTSLYSFPSLSAFNSDGVAVNTTGANPRARLLLAADGNYYGTAYQGGAAGYGTVFRMTPAGAVSVVHAFTGLSEGGAFPLAGVIQDADGSFYGTTVAGGYRSVGTAWRINSSGQFRLLHAFVDLGPDGKTPYAGLLLANGAVYGASSTDSSEGKGTIFKLDLGSGGVLPVEFSISPAAIVRGETATLTWSSPTAVGCIAIGAWPNDELAASGTVTVTPTLPSIYAYGIACVDSGGGVRHAFTYLTASGPAVSAVDGGGGGGGLSVSLLLLLAALLFRKSLKEIFASCP